MMDAKEARERAELVAKDPVFDKVMQCISYSSSVGSFDLAFYGKLTPRHRERLEALGYQLSKERDTDQGPITNIKW